MAFEFVMNQIEMQEQDENTIKAFVFNIRTPTLITLHNLPQSPVLQLAELQSVSENKWQSSPACSNSWNSL